MTPDVYLAAGAVIRAEASRTVRARRTVGTALVPAGEAVAGVGTVVTRLPGGLSAVMIVLDTEGAVDASLDGLVLGVEGAKRAGEPLVVAAGDRVYAVFPLDPRGGRAAPSPVRSARDHAAAGRLVGYTGPAGDLADGSPTGSRTGAECRGRAGRLGRALGEARRQHGRTAQLFQAMPPEAARPALRLKLAIDDAGGRRQPAWDVAGATATWRSPPGSDARDGCSQIPAPNATAVLDRRHSGAAPPDLPGERAMPEASPHPDPTPPVAGPGRRHPTATSYRPQGPEASRGGGTRAGVVDDGSRADAIAHPDSWTGIPNKASCPARPVARSTLPTPLAGNDDDGWVAVLLSNRLPRPGVAYRACLISVEGQLAALPDVRDAVDDRPGKVRVYEHLSAETLAAARFSATGNPVPLGATNQPAAAPAGCGRRRASEDWVRWPGAASGRAAGTRSRPTTSAWRVRHRVVGAQSTWRC